MSFLGDSHSTGCIALCILRYGPNDLETVFYLTSIRQNTLKMLFFHKIQNYATYVPPLCDIFSQLIVE